MNEKWQSRKWLGFLLVLTLAFVLTLLKKMTGDNFVGIVTILAPAYFVADVAQDQLSRRAPQQ